LFGRQEARVNENSRAVAAAIVGAVIGGVVGYLFLTERGRTLRRQMEPTLDDLARELNSFRATVQKASGIASEGWKLIGEALGEVSDRSPRYGSLNPTSPF
jgi:gas vesicle protein